MKQTGSIEYHGLSPLGLNLKFKGFGILGKGCDQAFLSGAHMSGLSRATLTLVLFGGSGGCTYESRLCQIVSLSHVRSLSQCVIAY